MKYRFDLKYQLVSGLVSFLTALAILYLFAGDFRWPAAIAVGIVNFIVSGYGK